MAAFFGVGLDTVKQWRETGMPGAKGRWDLGEIARWRLGRGAPDAVYKEARAREQQLRVAKLEGKVIPRKEHEAILDAICRAMSAALAAAPTELARRVANKTAAEARKAIDDWCTSQSAAIFGAPES